MSSRISIPGGSSDASRPPSRTRTRTSALSRPNILTATSDQRLNANGNANGNDETSIRPLAKKRSHDALAVEEDLLKPPIVVKPHPQNLSVKPRSLQPLMLLPREHLQLSFLDLHSPFGSFESARYFESNIKILDLEGRVGARPVVLLARIESDKTIYALERQHNGLYSICQLGSWVDLATLCELATVSCSHLIKRRPSHAADSNIPQPIITHQVHNENKKRKLAIEAIQSLVKRPARSRSVSTPTQAISLATQLSITLARGEITTRQDGNSSVNQNVITLPASTSQAQSQVPTAPGGRVDESPTQPTANDIFDNIRNQYMEALYHSMGSLAYFAKGPLSRARAAFHLDCDSTLEMNDLIDFLKSLVMNTVQIDKKYRETLPDIISKMNPMMQDSENEHSSGKTKKTKVKKLKLGKDGLYPLENEHVRKWWNIHKPQPKDDETTTTSPHETRFKISYLRSRETQLQMIIILEILALEPLRIPDNAADSQLPGMPGTDAGGDTPKQVPAKKRNRHNFPFLLDVHADRLCIWQSTALDEVKMMDDSQVAHKSEAQNSLRPTSDPLKDFCVDVIMPFFSARLPEQCDSINRKLGGPVMAPPSAKIKSRNSDVAVKSKPKPGSSAKRSVPVKSTKPLDKVLSRETEKHRRSMSRGPSGYIALLRSTSTSMLKREGSEPFSMTNVSKKESSETGERASSESTSTGLVRRKTVENKAQKEAIVKAELQDAINSLRRPNRDVVSKDMAETAERRATTSLSQLRKSKKPTQHPRVPGGIVKATPMGVSRFRDALARDAYSQPATTSTSYMESIEADHVPSSSSLIPSSAPRRKRNRDTAFATIPNESPVALPTTTTTSRRSFATTGGHHHHIEATPGRPSALKHTNFFVTPQQRRRSEENDDDAILASSPVAARSKKIPQPNFAVPARRRRSLVHVDSGIGMMPSSPPGLGSGGGTLAETPIKKSRSFQQLDERALIAATPAKARDVAVAVAVAETMVTATTTSDAGNKVVAAAVATAEQPQTQAQTPRRPSIYERLGWDDGFDELG